MACVRSGSFTCASHSQQQCFAKRMFRIEDLQAYMMRLFLEYAVRAKIAPSMAALTASE